MKIKLLDAVIVRGLDKPRIIGRGEVIELDAIEAKTLIESGLAESVDVVETATAKPKTSKACARIQPLESRD